MKCRLFSTCLTTALSLMLIVSCETTPPAAANPDLPPLQEEGSEDTTPPLAPQEQAATPEPLAAPPEEKTAVTGSAKTDPLPPAGERRAAIPDLPGLSLRQEPPAAEALFPLDEGLPPDLEPPSPSVEPVRAGSGKPAPEPLAGKDTGPGETPASRPEPAVPASPPSSGTVAVDEKNSPARPASALEPAPDVGNAVPAEPPAAKKTENPLTGREALSEAPPPEIPPLAITPPLIPEEEPVFSRSVRAQPGQIVEIPFRGASWVYVGERFSRPGLDYQGRRLDGEGQSFSFVARQEGMWELSFFKHDFVADRTFRDYVRLIISPAPEAAFAALSGMEARVVAERWPPLEDLHPLSLPAAGAGKQPAEPVMEAPVGEPPVSAVPLEREEDSSDISPSPPSDKAPDPPMTPEALLEAARSALGEKQGSQVNSLLQRYLESVPQGGPAAFLLFARMHELEGPSRDIKRARYWYGRILQDFPLSAEALEAAGRAQYLDRFYFGIR